MKPASWTVMVVGGAHQGVRRFSLKKRLFSLGFVALGGLGVCTTAGAAHYATLSDSVYAARAAEAERDALAAHLAALGSRLTVAENALAQLDGVDAELRALTHFGPGVATADKAAVERGVAAGGSADEVEPFATPLLVDAERGPVDLEASRIDTLADDAQRQVGSLKSLLGYFASRAQVLASTPSIWPADGAITSEFGRRDDPFTGAKIMHAGVDVGAPEGRQVIAPADGTVIQAGNSGGYGQLITLDHGRGITTNYGHLSRILVEVGDKVKRGQHIGAVGNTGRSTGPHLHYEVRKDGMPINPRKYVLEW